MPNQVPEIGGRLPRPIDQTEWDKAATEYAIGSLDRLRGAAEKWLGTMSTLIGLFGAVVVIGGPASLAEVQPPWARPVVLVGLGLAAILAAIGVLNGAFAVQGVDYPRWEGWNGDRFAAYQLVNGDLTVRYLRRSRVFGILAAALVLLSGLGAAGLSLVPPEPSVDDQYAVVITSDGRSLCGLISSVDGKLAVAGTPVAGAAQVIPVAGC